MSKIINKLANKTVLQNIILRSSVTSVRSASKEHDWIPEDKPTHTGQQFDKDDYRLARFVGRSKHVNENFAINLIAKVPPKPAKDRVVWCDGGDEHTGHPRVYINLDKPGNHTCGYCGLRFFKDGSHH